MTINFDRLHFSTASLASDKWSFGVLMWEVCFFIINIHSFSKLHAIDVLNITDLDDVPWRVPVRLAAKQRDLRIPQARQPTSDSAVLPTGGIKLLLFDKSVSITRFICKSKDKFNVVSDGLRRHAAVLVSGPRGTTGHGTCPLSPRGVQE